MDGRDDVLPRHESPVQVGRAERPEGRQVGAEIGGGLDAQAQKLAVLVQRQLGVGDMVAAVGVGHEGLAALGGPFHRPADFLRRPGDQDLLRIMGDL